MGNLTNEVATERAELSELESTLIPVADVLESVDKHFVWMSKRLRDVASEISPRIPPEFREAVLHSWEMQVQEEERFWKTLRAKFERSIDELKFTPADAPVEAAG
jgi:hypothetical protein